MFDAIAFAGGGNRCYWQGGFWEAAAPRLRLAPTRVVGVSAGAWAACYSLLGLGPRVRERVIAGCSQGVPNLDVAAWRRGGRLFPVADLYRALITEILDADAFARLKAGPEILIAVARRPRRLPLPVAIPLGILTYQLEKALAGPVHPRGGRVLGFTSDFVPVSRLASPGELVGALIATASVPPIMPIGLVGGLPALDGGLVDNVPVEPLVEIEARGGRTLVLLTRRYGRHPQVRGRTYVQPSRKIAVGQFDLTKPQAIAEAYALGLADGAAFAESMSRSPSSSSMDETT